LSSKPLSYEALMLLSPQEIQALFPYGAMKVKNLWTPADDESKADKSLRKLLKDKKARSEELRYLDKNPARPPTTQPHRAAEDAPLIPKNWQERYSKEAEEREAARKDVTVADALKVEKRNLEAQLSVRQQVAKERGIAIRSDIRVIEKRLAEIDRRLGLAA